MKMYSFIDRWVYRNSQKPKHYIEVKDPPKTVMEKFSRPQDARQMQYNKWCRRYKIYSGSYLPENDRRLLKKGWEDKKYLKMVAKSCNTKAAGKRSEAIGMADPTIIIGWIFGNSRLSTQSTESSNKKNLVAKMFIITNMEN